jgi:hypothetical protein
MTIIAYVGITYRVKIVINDNIIEQITDFKYLWYHISECKSDLEDSLQKHTPK